MKLPHSLGIALFAMAVSAPVFAFDMDELKGLWAESTHSRFACTPTNRYQRFALSSDGKHLVITAQRGRHGKTTSDIELDVLRSDEHSMLLTFPGHTAPDDPLTGEWALSLLGPGVYRWHLASEHEGLKAAPIGVRCAS